MERWSLSEIVGKMIATPRSQFCIYYTDQVPVSRQREIVCYKSGNVRGCVRRQQDDQASQVVHKDYLYQAILGDVQAFQHLYFTFVTSPVYGLAAQSENFDVRNTHQVTYPLSIRQSLVA